MPHDDPTEPLSTRDLRTLLGLLTEDEVARALGIVGPTLKIWRNRGEGPAFFRFRRNLFYRTADVTQWLIENTVDPESDELIAPKYPGAGDDVPQTRIPRFTPLPREPEGPKHKPPTDPEKIIADLDRMVDKLNASRDPDDQLRLDIHPSIMDAPLSDEERRSNAELRARAAKSTPPPGSPSGGPEAGDPSAEQSGS